MEGSPYAQEQDAPIHLFDLNLHIAPICDGREPGPPRWGILSPDCDPPPAIEANQTQRSTTEQRAINMSTPQNQHRQAWQPARWVDSNWTRLASRLAAPSRPRLSRAGLQY